MSRPAASLTRVWRDRDAPGREVPSRSRSQRVLARLLPPFLTGALLAAAFPPLDIGLLGFVAPVPLLLAWRCTTPRRAALDGFLAGVVFFGMLVVWAWFFGVVAYFPFVVVLAAYWAAAGAFVGMFSRRGVNSPWVVASVWVLFEALRGRWPLGGFSWGEVGYAFHNVPVVRSLAAWGGVLLVSFVAVLTAAYLAQVVIEWRERARAAAFALMGIAAVVLAGHVFLPETTPGNELRVAMVQGNDRNRDLTREERIERYLPVSHFDLARQLESDVDLVVFPESSLDEDPRIDPFLEEQLGTMARRLDAAVLANAAVEIEGGRRLHNTNFFYGPSGTLEGTYVKQHLVPYGEYVPGRSFLGFIEELEQIPRDHAPGDRPVIFTVGNVSVGNLICFESAFTELAREYTRLGAEVLVVSTNNRSFRRSANSAQHVAIGKMRAIESGRPVIHAGISGHSALITPGGSVVEQTELFERTTLVADVVGRSGRTPYVVFGDWVVVLTALSVGVAALRARRDGGG